MGIVLYISHKQSWKSKKKKAVSEKWNILLSNIFEEYSY